LDLMHQRGWKDYLFVVYEKTADPKTDWAESARTQRAWEKYLNSLHWKWNGSSLWLKDERAVGEPQLINHATVGQKYLSEKSCKSETCDSLILHVYFPPWFFHRRQAIT
jgi:hypothetical protein